MSFGHPKEDVSTQDDEGDDEDDFLLEANPFVATSLQVASVRSLPPSQLLTELASRGEEGRPTRRGEGSGVVGRTSFAHISYATPVARNNPSLSGFDFSTPSPDDIVLAAQGAAFERPAEDGAGLDTPPGFPPPTGEAGSGQVVDAADMMGLGTMVDADVRQAGAEAAAEAAEAEAEAVAAAAEVAAAMAGPSGGVHTGMTPPTTPRSARLFVRRRTKLNKKIGKEILEARAAAQEGKRIPLNLVVVGHVDHGKSTLMGHVLLSLEHVTQRDFARMERNSAQAGKGSFAFAWVLDAHEEERERGITMDVAVTNFQTPRMDVTLLDTPGHRDYVPNMITGAAQADAALLVVSAAQGEFESGFEAGGQTGEHAQLLRSLGVQSLIVVVNKMDLAEWDQNRFNEIQSTLKRFLKPLGFRNVPFVPVSGLAGLNLRDPIPDGVAPWYSGPALLEAIDALPAPERDVDGPLRMPVTDIFRPSSSSGAVVSGKIETGTLRLDDQVLLLPGDEIHMIKTIIARDVEESRWAEAGENVELVLREGDVNTLAGVRFVCDPEYPIPMTSRFKARIIVLDGLSTPITPGYPVVLHYHNVNEDAVITRLRRLHPADGSPEEEAYAARCAAAEADGKPVPRRRKPRRLVAGQEATVEVTVTRTVCIDTFANCKEMGRVMLREGGNTIACGIVLKLYFDVPSSPGGESTQGAFS